MTDFTKEINAAPDEATHYVFDVDVYFSIPSGTYYNKALNCWEITDFRTVEDLKQNYAKILDLNNVKLLQVALKTQQNQLSPDL